MKRYYISLLLVTLALTLLSFAVMWLAPQKYLPVMPLLALYFCIVTGVQHWVVCKAMYKSPRAFVSLFLGSIVAVLLLHIVVLVIYLLNNPAHAKLFALAFCVGYVVCLAFETVSLVLFVNRQRNRNK
jgi:hypothetical protein